MYFLYQLYIDPKVGLDCIKYAPPQKKVIWEQTVKTHKR